MGPGGELQVDGVDWFEGDEKSKTKLLVNLCLLGMKGSYIEEAHQSCQIRLKAAFFKLAWKNHRLQFVVFF